MKLKARSRKALQEAKLVVTGWASGVLFTLLAIVAMPQANRNDSQNREIEKDMVIQAIHMTGEGKTQQPTPTPTPPPRSTMHVTQKINMLGPDEIKRILDNLAGKK